MAEPIELPDFPGYRVTENGQILGKTAKTSVHGLKPKINKRTGYREVHLVHTDGSKETKSVHVLVCIVFHGERPDSDAHAAHIDGDKSNNSARNIIWKSPSENQMDRFLHGTDCSGEKNYNSRITAAEVMAMRAERSEGWTYKQIGANYGISAGYARKIIIGEKRRNG